MEALVAFFPRDTPGWLLPLSVFYTFYRHMLMIIDNEELFEQQKPLSLQDVKALVIILKEAFSQLLWVLPSKTLAPQKRVHSGSSQKKNITIYPRESQRLNFWHSCRIGIIGHNLHHHMIFMLVM